MFQCAYLFVQPPSLTPQNARLRHAFSTLSLSIPLPPRAGTSYVSIISSVAYLMSTHYYCCYTVQIEQLNMTKTGVSNYVIDTTTVDMSSDRTVSPDEELTERTIDKAPKEDTATVTSEELNKGKISENQQVSLPQSSDEYISGVISGGNDNSVRRRSILFTEDYISQSGSLDDGPTLPSTPPPGPLISPCLRSSAAISSPRLSWLFTSPSTPDGVSISELSLSPPELPLSPPPGKTLSPRSSSAALAAIPDFPQLTTIPLYKLPLAEVVRELDEPIENTADDSNTSQTVSDNDEKIKTNSEADNIPPESYVAEEKDMDNYEAPHRSSTFTRQDALHVLDSGVDTEAENNEKKPLSKVSSPSDLESDIQSTIESFMTTSTLAASLDQPKRRESSSTAPTEISYTSEETQHAKNIIPRSNSTNSLVS